MTHSPSSPDHEDGRPMLRPQAEEWMALAQTIGSFERAENGDPFATLGVHAVGEGVWEVRAMLPEATEAALVPEADAPVVPMTAIGQHGFFVARLAGPIRPRYKLRVTAPFGVDVREDPYRFGPWLRERDLAALREPSGEAVTRFLGARPANHGGALGYVFTLWAPNAWSVSVVADFNGWDGRRHPMRCHRQTGVWELFIPRIGKGERYKFQIKGPDSQTLALKADPLAFRSEHPPANASITEGPMVGLPVATAGARWRAERGLKTHLKSAVSIYEVHLGSWAKVPEEGNRFLTYRELAERLIPYVADMGFTHIELMPITEFPFDGSWGYQTVAMFAPTSRFGTPADFAAFVEAAHAADIGLILDWVPGHFPTDPHGLALFDGTHLYEHADPRQGFHQDWGTYIYNFGRDEVKAFLVASARYWTERWQFDGLRVDAVASMLYLDYSRKDGEWVPNAHGGRDNLEAVDFLRTMNTMVHAGLPGVMTIAEESTAWPGVSAPPDTGGLGFSFKWNMGWMHDTLGYMGEDPINRRWHHGKLTFGLVYAFSENFVLPLSHDEVVHGKGSLLSRMPGDRWQRFANLRAYFGFMWGHPGKKLLFMGGEFAQAREWNYHASLDWHLLHDADHRGVHDCVRALNRAYTDHPALWQRDAEPGGFEWLVVDDADASVIAFARYGQAGAAPVLVVTNFTPVPRYGYRIGVHDAGRYAEIVNTDAQGFGGSNVGNHGGTWTQEGGEGRFEHALTLTLPPLATLILARQDGE